MPWYLQTIAIEDEETLLRACHAIFVKLRANQVIRPYSQPFVTSRLVNYLKKIVYIIICEIEQLLLFNLAL